jgi:ADP-ribose pyrophosphatase YjhB (NUDIX family)
MKDKVICKDVYGNEYECPVDMLDVRIGVYAIIVRDSKILLARQWDGFSLVGGGVEKGESLEEAFVREVKEETGLSVKPGKLIYHTTTFFKRDKESRARQSHQFYFVHNELDGELHNECITDSEKLYTNDLPEWVDLSEIDQIDFRHSVDLKTILFAYNSVLKMNRLNHES